LSRNNRGTGFASREDHSRLAMAVSRHLATGLIAAAA